MSPSAARSAEGIRLDLESFEVDLLRSLPESLHALLHDPDPTDPAVARLFPACVDGDEETDIEVRQLIYDDLLEARIRGLEEFVEILDRGEERRGRLTTELVDDEPHLVLGVLNDLRLVLGARAGIERLDRDAIGPDHPAASTIAVMDHLAWIQEEILRIVDPPSVG